MDEHGKITDVRIETVICGEHDMFVWADPGLADLIRSVVGVIQVNERTPSEYHVYIDHRYDRTFVGDEIVAAIKCR